MTHLGYTISDQTVGNILKRRGISPAPARKKTVTWREFIRCHLDVLLATDFFTSDIWSWFGLMIASLFAFIHFSRDAVSTVETTLHQQMQGMLFFMRLTLDLRPHVYSWRHWVRQVSRSRAMQWSEGSRRPPVSEVMTHDDRAPILRIRAKVVSMPSGGSCQTRDGPMQHRQRLDKLLINNQRQAA